MSAASSLSPEALLAAAQTNRSHRIFKLSLQELCLRTVAENELFYATRMTDFIASKLPSPMKQLVLTELSSKVMDRPRYPGGKLRVKFVLMLIYTGLEEFDFSVCNTQRVLCNQQIWECLATKAGRSLKILHDLRQTFVVDAHATGSWCMYYLAKMPNLEELRLTSIQLRKYDLIRLATLHPKLKRLQVVSPKRLLDVKQKLSKFSKLEEFQLGKYNDEMETTTAQVAKLLQSSMPNLKICCYRVDYLYYHQYSYKHFSVLDDQVPRSVKRASNLEHATVNSAIGYIRPLKAHFSNVKHLLLVDAWDPSLPYQPIVDYTKTFVRLRTLHLVFDNFQDQALPLLKLNGHSLTTLVLHDLRGHPAVDLTLLLECCPKLTALRMTEGLMQASRVLNHASLLELTLAGVISHNPNFLSRVLRLPQLQKLVMTRANLQIANYQEATKDLASGTLQLSKLQSFKFLLAIYKSAYSGNDILTSARAFVTHVLSLSPNLQEAFVSLGNGGERQPQPFLKLVNS